MAESDYIPDEISAVLEDIYSWGEEAEAEELQALLAQLPDFSKRYEQLEYHSLGGSKTIYSARESHTGRTVAIASIRDEKQKSVETILRFVREARITAVLEHPAIVPVYELGRNQFGKPFFVMRFLQDESLRKVIKEHLKKNPAYLRDYPPQVLLEIFLKICDAVAYAHSCGILHLDLKPENIMLGRFGEVYVCDWGLAKIINSEQLAEELTEFEQHWVQGRTLEGQVKGTPGYMAPEQVNPNFGDPSTATDVYALGAVLYSILTHRAPLEGLPLEAVMSCTMNGNIPAPQEVAPINQIPSALSAIAAKAMSLQPKDRYQTVQELADELRNYNSGFAVSAENGSLWHHLGLFVSRHKMVIIPVMVFLFFGSVFWVAWLKREQRVNKEELIFKEKMEQKLEALMRYNNQLTRLVAQHEARLSEEKDSRPWYTLDPKDQCISINFTDGGDGFPRTDYAIGGLVEVGFWETIHAKQGRRNTDPQNLRNQLGQATGVSFDMVTPDGVGGNWFIASGFDTERTNMNNEIMVNWTEIAGRGWLYFNGVRKLGKTYDVIIYSARNLNNHVARFEVEGKEVMLTSDGAQAGPFRQAVATTIEESTAKRGMNYAVFRGLTAEQLVIEVEAMNYKGVSHWAPICGIQIIGRDN